ncbi:MAG: LOG family protein [Bacteroidota bacterium]
MSKVISVFGSSKPREGDKEYRLAQELGRELARAGFVICNGGYGGIMEASARGAKEAGGQTIGVTVKIYSRTANRWVDKEIRTKSLVERLANLVDTADAYVILKGGTGTLLELAYVWEFINKGMIPEKPIVLVGDFWKSVVETLREELLWEGLGDCTRFLTIVQSPQECVEVLKEKLG